MLRTGDMAIRPPALAGIVLLLSGCVLAACATPLPRYDPHPPEVRLEVRGLTEGALLLRPGSAAVERELGRDGDVDLSVSATHGGGVQRVALVGRVTVGCHNAETGARTTDASDVVHEDVADVGPGGMVRTAASVARRIRASDYGVRCVDPGGRPFVEGSFRGEAEDFHGRWSATASFTFWFTPPSSQVPSGPRKHGQVDQHDDESRLVGTGWDERVGGGKEGTVDQGREAKSVERPHDPGQPHALP